MIRRLRKASIPRTVATIAIAAALVLPASAFGVAPTVTMTAPLPGPGDGRGLSAGIPGADGWWVVPPFIALSSDQDGTVLWHWDGDPDTAQTVTAGVPFSVLTPEGDHTLVVAAANGVAETSTPVVQRFLVDSQAPSQPLGFSATLVPPTGVQLVWTASTDPAPASGVTGYRIYRKTGLPPFAPSDAVATVLGAGTLAYLDPVGASAQDYIYAVAAVDAAGNESPLTEIDPTPTLLPVYRFFNFRTGAHFYTADGAERDQVLRTLGWTFSYEGVSYQANGTATGAVPLYRFFNFRNGTHFYTASEAEKLQVERTLGWTYRYEGIAYYVMMNPLGTTPVHRFFNFRTGTHFYTANEAEKLQVERTLGWTFRYEGVVFYVLR